jgi:membrane protease subunit HflK
VTEPVSSQPAASRPGPGEPGREPGSDPRGALTRSVEASFRFLRWAALLAAVAVLASGVRVIGPDEVGLVIRVGQLVGETRAEQVRGPGLLVAMPYLIDRVVRVPVKKVQRVRVRELIGKQRSDWVDLTKDGYALTGDRGVVQLEATGRYRIADPVAYALRVARPRRVVHDALVAALTHACAGRAVDSLLARGKKALTQAALADARRRLSDLGVGVRLLSLELDVVRPPPQTAAAFQDVQSAFIEQKTQIERAKSYANQRELMAQARARKDVLSAKARADWSRASARGRAQAFGKLALQDKRLGALLRQRLYREAMEAIFAKVGARLLVPPGSGPLRLRIPAGATMLRPRTAPTPPATPWERVPPKGER